MANGFMLDTTVFNHVLRDAIDSHALRAGGPLFVTHVQRDELEATVDAGKRGQLLEVFAAAPSHEVPTESAMWDISNWGSRWSREDGLVERMLEALNQRNGCRRNNPRDILITEAALRNQFCLVTDDADLSDVVQQFGGETVRLQDFVKGPA